MISQAIGFHLKMRKTLIKSGYRFLADPPLPAAIEGTTFFEGNSVMRSL